MRVVLAVLVTAAWLTWPSRPQAGAVAARVVLGVSDGSSHAGPWTARRASAAPGRTRPRPATAEDLATAMDLLTLTLRAGLGVVEAIEAVAARVDGEAGRQLATVAAALRWGLDDTVAWSAVPRAWLPAARALRMAAVAGVPPADLLTGAADDLRRAEAQRVDLATARVGVRVVLPLGLAFLPAFVLSTVIPIVLALTHQVLGR